MIYLLEPFKRELFPPENRAKSCPTNPNYPFRKNKPYEVVVHVENCLQNVLQSRLCFHHLPRRRTQTGWEAGGGNAEKKTGGERWKEKSSVERETSKSPMYKERPRNNMSNNSRVSMSFSSAWYKNRPTVLQGRLVKLRVSFAPFPVVLSSRNVCAYSASPSTRHSITDAPAASRVDGIYESCNFADVRPLISSRR